VEGHTDPRRQAQEPAEHHNHVGQLASELPGRRTDYRHHDSDPDEQGNRRQSPGPQPVQPSGYNRASPQGAQAGQDQPGRVQDRQATTPYQDGSSHGQKRAGHFAHPSIETALPYCHRGQGSYHQQKFEAQTVVVAFAGRGPGHLRLSM
jgi:hypothetical protein